MNNKKVIHCRKCGGKMREERTDFDHIHRVCECGFRDRTPCTRMTTSVNPYQKEDLFARIRFKEGGDVMLEVSGRNDSGYELLSLDEISRLIILDTPLPDILDEITGKISRRMGV
ncbi:MAG TPA: hypothetical protein VK863_07280 [Candidatus Limnocylindrales bacterium]|nr:hypothetical protein [Candidatus Limnocylindrales bacterium]